MIISPHSLHPIVVRTDIHKEILHLKLKDIAHNLRTLVAEIAAGLSADRAVIPLTTVSLNSNFDAYINIQFRGHASGSMTSLIVDSGNSMLIVPYWEEIEGLSGYTILVEETREPWGNPAKIVQGPIEIPTRSGETFTLEDCVFYACTGGDQRTANFGTGCVLPWSANGWNTPEGLEVTMQAPLSYNTQYPFAEFKYAPATTMFASMNTLMIAPESRLVLSRSRPAGYSMLNIIPDLEWMSLRPKSLTIGKVLTQWPGEVDSPIAMIDTGGGPVFLSDPNGYLYESSWPHPALCPLWTSDSESCVCVSDNVTLELDGVGATSPYRYTIHTRDLPASVQGLTLVMCKVNSYMRGQQGMNIGGVSALFNDILIDYANGQVGFKLKL